MIRRNEDAPAGSALIGGFSFALLAGLAILSLLIVVMGAKVYRSIDEAATLNNQSRTVLSYIAGKVRATDAAGMIDIEQVEGGDALVLSEDLGGARYASYIYYADGGLYECFTRADRGLDTRLADRLVDVRGFSVTLSGRLLTVSVTDDAGETRALSLYLQSGEKEGAA